LLAQLGIDADYTESNDAGLYTGKQAAVIVDGKSVGVVGEIKPQVAAAFELKPGVYLFELNLTQLLPHTLGHNLYSRINRFPPVVRDIALVVDDKVSHRHLLDAIKGFPLVERVSLFDVYAGKQVLPGKKSLAYRISYQSAEYTLTDKEVDKVQQKILAKLSGKFGATLRA
jgi:phenylalanyl-tRNA synthetase beta chain